MGLFGLSLRHGLLDHPLHVFFHASEFGGEFPVGLFRLIPLGGEIVEFVGDALFQIGIFTAIPRFS